MTYVALLRGINVGGNCAVDMRALRATFDRLGFGNVRSYINSGNVVFTASNPGDAELARRIEAAVAGDFGVAIPLVLRTAAELAMVAESVPAAWVNDASMKCDVFFLWPDVDRPSIVDDVPHNPAIEDLRYVPGALVRRIDREHVNRSPLTRIVGTDLYRRMTARNINTVRKLRDLAAAG
ncbi:MAG: hypothetical protein QOG43_1605 [Actinomycetota bacterium]|nr:hypothetical protein [Actinomycetota bacterium]